MSTIDDVKIFTFPQLGDSRGNLVVVEGGRDRHIPFIIKRIFYIYATKKEVVRGKHANRYSEFCLINVCGSSKIKVFDQNFNERIFTLDTPNIGIYLPKMLWKEMYDFSEDSILLVLSNNYYDKDEYISDWDTYHNEQ